MKTKKQILAKKSSAKQKKSLTKNISHPSFTHVFKPNGNGFFSVFFSYAIVYGLFGLVSSIFVLTQSPIVTSPFLSVLTFIFVIVTFIMSIVGILQALRYKKSVAYFVLPIYHLILLVCIFAFAVFVNFGMSDYRMAQNALAVSTIVDVITSLFELVFASFMLYKMHEGAVKSLK